MRHSGKLKTATLLCFVQVCIFLLLIWRFNDSLLSHFKTLGGNKRPQNQKNGLEQWGETEPTRICWVGKDGLGSGFLLSASLPWLWDPAEWHKTFDMHLFTSGLMHLFVCFYQMCVLKSVSLLQCEKCANYTCTPYRKPPKQQITRLSVQLTAYKRIN